MVNFILIEDSDFVWCYGNFLCMEKSLLDPVLQKS